MSWRLVGDAVALTEDGGRKGAMKATSSASILIGDSFPSIRMYIDRQTAAVPLTADFDTDPLTGELVESADPRLWANENYPALTCAWYTERERTSHFLPYLDSTRFSWTRPSASLSFGLDVHPDPTNPWADENETLLSSTCIPGFRIAWINLYERREYYLTRDGCKFRTVKQEGDFYTIYKDPSIVEIPADTPGGNGYLMVMARVRILTSDATDGLTATDPFSAIGNLKNPGGCFSDIVAFWAPTPDFRIGLKGPFLLVDSLDALDYEHRRAWLGVPGAVFSYADPASSAAGMHLYVYYVVERHDGPGTEASGLSEPVVGCSGSAMDEDDPSHESAPILVPGTPFARSSSENASAPETRGIAVRRFALLNLLTEIASAGEWILEPVRPVTGDNLGFAYFWIATGTGVECVHFEARLERGLRGQRTTIAVADPQPKLCGDQLALYFSAISSFGIPRYASAPDATQATGHGIWRSAALPDRFAFTLPDGSTRRATFGVDFVISPLVESKGRLPGVSSFSCVDLLLHSTPAVMYLDPDPLQVPGGSWRVFVGQDLGEGKIGALLRVDGSEDDGCRSWAAAFAESVGEAPLLAAPVDWGSVPAHLRPIDQSKGLGALVGSDPDMEQDWPAPIDWSNAAVVGLHPHGKGPDEVTQSDAASTSGRYGRSARKATQAPGPTSGQVVSKGPSGGCGCGG